MTDGQGRCPIWGTSAEIYPPEDGQYFVQSYRAGQIYWISVEAANDLRRPELYDNRMKARLTTWLIEQAEIGVSPVRIDTALLDEVKNWPDMGFNDRCDNILKFIARRCPTLGDELTFRAAIPDGNLPDHEMENFLEIMACSGSSGPQDCFFVLQHLAREGVILLEENDIRGFCRVEITAKGHMTLADLRATTTTGSKAFVAMWFHDSMNEAYEAGIKPAILKAGYEPARVDRQEHLNKIDDQIVAEIRRSRFLVADFTHGKKGARGGVYYEAGFAHGLNIPVIFACRKDFIECVHFDTRQYNHIVWDNPYHLREQLTNRISAAFGDGPLEPPP